MQERAHEQLERCGHTIVICDCSDRGAMGRKFVAERDRVDVVVVGGGDGTLVSAIPGLLESKLPLGILPLGTFNELARTLRIPPRLDDACILLESGARQAIDVGMVNGKPYFNEASLGISTHIASTQTRELKRRLGPLAMPYTTLKALPSFVPFHVNIESEGTRFRLRTLQVTIANSHRFGGLVENPDAAIDDGMLDIYSFSFARWTDAISVIGSIVTRRFPNVRGVETRRAPSFHIATRRPRHIYTDGEPATKTPADFSVIPRAVTVIVPE